MTAPRSVGHSGLADYATLLGKELERRGFDIVPPGGHELAVYNFTPYANGVYLGWLRAVRAVRSLGRGGRPVITVFHEVFELSDRRLRMCVFAILQQWAHRRLVAASSAVVVSDDARARALAALAPRLRSPIVLAVGPNVPVPSGAPYRSERPIVATFGLPHPLRDVETLVRAAQLVAAETPRVRFVVLGDYRGNPEAAAHLDALGRALDAPIEITGALAAEEIAERLRETRVFVSTYTESLSLGSGGLAAALGHGAAVVVYEAARLSPPIAAGVHVLVAPRDPAGLARTIGEALSASADPVAAAGRALYERAASWEAIGDRFEALIGDVLSRRAAA